MTTTGTIISINGEITPEYIRSIAAELESHIGAVTSVVHGRCFEARLYTGNLVEVDTRRGTVSIESFGNIVELCLVNIFHINLH